MKARYIGCTHDGWEHTELFCEYKGHEYVVTKHNNGYMGESLRRQHNEAKRQIDEMISRENEPILEWEYKGSAQEGFDMFGAYVEDGIDC